MAHLYDMDRIEQNEGAVHAGVRISNIICYHLVQNLLSSLQLFKNVKINIYKTEILPVVFLGVQLGH
jgi:hypothetical protein